MIDIKRLINQIENELELHDYHYYVLNEPLIPDEEYDKLERKLRHLKDKIGDTSEQVITLKPDNKLKQVKMSIAMQSLDNAFVPDELNSFFKRVNKLLLEKGISDTDIEYTAEPKFDGLACNIRYVNGVLELANTRGTGLIGEDVTHNVIAIESIPKRISAVINGVDVSELIEVLEVRGEVIMSKASLKKANHYLTSNNEKILSSTRNAAAGTLRHTNPEIVKHRKLSFYSYGIGEIKFRDPNMTLESLGVKSYSEILDFLILLGFPVCKDLLISKNPELIIEHCYTMGDNREQLAFDIDGVVIKINSLKYQNLLRDREAEEGKVRKFPLWAIAWKFPPKEKKTILKDVIYQVGMSGVITPVAVVEPVEIQGVIVERASLYNVSILVNMNLHIGDTVFVCRTGDVIPKITTVVPSLRKKNAKPISIPNKCPSCKHDLILSNTLIEDLLCVNSNCPERVISKLEFISKLLGPLYLGRKGLEKLYHTCDISNALELLNVSEVDLERSGVVKDVKMSRQLIAISNAKLNMDLEKVYTSLCIPNVGEHMAHELAKRFPIYSDLINASEESIKGIKGAGKHISKSIIEFFSIKENKDLLKGICELCNVGLVDNPIPSKTTKLSFAITGTFPNYSRHDLELMVKRSGNINRGVTKTTDYLVVGASPGESKLDKANMYNVKQINLDEFLSILDKK